MKISVNDQEILTLTETQKDVIRHDIPTELFDEDMKRRVRYILVHKYEQCFKRLKKEWDEKLRQNGVAMIPTDPEAYAQLVFSQPNYQNRSQRSENDI